MNSTLHFIYGRNASYSYATSPTSLVHLLYDFLVSLWHASKFLAELPSGVLSPGIVPAAPAQAPVDVWLQVIWRCAGIEESVCGDDTVVVIIKLVEATSLDDGDAGTF